jgi:hypothetical protein
MSKRKLDEFEEEIEANKRFLSDINDVGEPAKYQHTLDSDESDHEDEA